LALTKFGAAVGQVLAAEDAQREDPLGVRSGTKHGSNRSPVGSVNTQR
jgi:hypothetical protein